MEEKLSPFFDRVKIKENSPEEVAKRTAEKRSIVINAFLNEIFKDETTGGYMDNIRFRICKICHTFLEQGGDIFHLKYYHEDEFEELTDRVRKIK